MKSNRILGVGAAVLMAAFAMGTSAQASPLSGASLATDGSLSMADTLATSAGTGFSDSTDVSFDACSGDECSETDDAVVLTSGGSSGTPGTGFAVVAAPEPASFVLVGLTLAVLPLIRKRRR
jgi:hypothetical protein